MKRTRFLRFFLKKQWFILKFFNYYLSVIFWWVFDWNFFDFVKYLPFLFYQISATVISQWTKANLDFHRTGFISGFTNLDLTNARHFTPFVKKFWNGCLLFWFLSSFMKFNLCFLLSFDIFIFCRVYFFILNNLNKIN